MNSSAATRPIRAPGPRRALTACLAPLAAMTAAVLLSVLLGWTLRALPAVSAWDLSLVVAANHSLTENAGRLAVGIDVAFGPALAAALVALAALLAGLLHRSRWAALRAALLVAVPWAIVELIKLVVRRPRPDADLLLQQLVPEPHTFSYPSGHTACAAAFATVLVLALPAGWQRRLALVPAVLLVLATAWSRVALGVHHPSDVLVSLLLVPVLCLFLARLLDLLHPAADPRPAGIAEGAIEGVPGGVGVTEDVVEEVTRRG
ncbi:MULTISPECIES: phosphatase PAP2 family protein [unclassified Brachybacterium]|uniref:phosphatase PAP2 family protein n=1 Tax=unclassified Brachybacterium TaxID=2623841 RepID=UPI00403411BE